MIVDKGVAGVSVLPRIFGRPGGDSDCKKPGSFNRKSNKEF